MKRIFYLLALLCPLFAGAQDIDYGGKVRLGCAYTVISGVKDNPDYKVNVKPVSDGIFTVTVSGQGSSMKDDDDFAGVFFKSVPELKQGLCYKRYEPYRTWTKPVQFKKMSELPENEVQAIYWQYNDGVYAVAAPLNGNGLRTTFGNDKGHFGSKATNCPEGYRINGYPSMVIGFGDDIYELYSQVYATALHEMGCSENLVEKKSLPHEFDYLGWCSWNALGNGPRHTADAIYRILKSFTERDIQLGYAIIDDGWHSNDDRTLENIYPNQNRYPFGFKDFVSKLKEDTGIKAVGVWCALDAYWNGMADHGPLYDKYKDEYFSWEQMHTPRSKKVSKCWYFRPDSKALPAFWESWFSYLNECDIDIVKIDNQGCTERLARKNYPADSLSAAMHDAVNKAAFKYLGGRMINCMAMTTEAFYHYGNTPVVRCSEDYFPYNPNETYNLEHGNAAAHIMQGIYNNMYISQMCYTDMDMFQSYNPNGELHAISRIMNNGPVYVTDSEGRQNVEILKKMILEDGRLLRADTPLLPCEESLFQVQDKKLFKVFSFSGCNALIGTFNLADCNKVSGTVSPADAHGIADSEKYLIYEHFSGNAEIVGKSDRIPVELGRMGYRLYYAIPYTEGLAVVGLVNKYNAPATVKNVVRKKNQTIISLAEGGEFVCVSDRAPKKIFANGELCENFVYENKVLRANIKGLPACELTINW